MPEDFADAVFAIPEGEMGEPFQTAIGWHLVEVIERAPSRVPPLEEVRAEIAAELTNSRRAAAVSSLLRSMRSRPKLVYYERAIRAEPAREHSDPSVKPAAAEGSSGAG